MGWCLFAGGQGLMLWPKINSINNSSTDSAFTCLKSLMEMPTNLWNLLKVNNRNSRLMSLTSFWCPNYYLYTHFTSYCSILVFLSLTMNRYNYSWVVGVTVLKNCDFLFVKNVEKRKNVVRGKLRTCDTSKMDRFAKIGYCLKLLTILTRSSILKSITGCWNILCLL